MTSSHALLPSSSATRRLGAVLARAASRPPQTDFGRAQVETKVARCLAFGADPAAHCPCQHRRPFLHAAALAGLPGAVGRLLAAGCLPDVADTTGATAMHLVSSPVVARALLAGGATLEAPFTGAISGGPVLRCVPLLKALFEGRWAAAGAMLEAGANPSAFSCDGTTALHHVVSWLGNRGNEGGHWMALDVDDRAIARYPWWAQEFISIPQAGEWLRRLLLAGANPGQPNNQDETPLGMVETLASAQAQMVIVDSPLWNWQAVQSWMMSVPSTTT